MRPEPVVRFDRARMCRIERMEDQHFWFVCRRRILASWLRLVCPPGACAVDVGAGTGYTVRWLEAQGWRAFGIEPLAAGEARGQIPMVCGVGERLPIRSGSIEVVLFLDVLEHADDAACLREAWRVLRPGGHVIVSVPAMPWLWSKRDEEAGHRRRYTKHDLLRLLRTTGFEPVACRYFVAFLFPIVAVTRIAGRWWGAAQRVEESPGRWGNALAFALTMLEVRLGDRLHWPFGSTLLALARRP